MFLVLLSFIFSILIAFSISVWIVAKFINKSNNKGDSKAQFFDFYGSPFVIDDKEDNKIKKVPLR